MTEEAMPQPARRRGRPPVREAAEATASQRRSQRSDQRRAPGRTETGRLRVNQNGDLFWIDDSRRPEHMRYQWNAVSVLGNDELPKRRSIMYAMNGWKPVPPDRHPEIVGAGFTGNEIVIGGLRLEERPEEMSLEAEQEDRENAENQVRNNFRQLKLNDAGQLPRADRHGRSLVSVKREQAIAVAPDASAYEYPDGERGV
jgi:hypothetical protein